MNSFDIRLGPFSDREQPTGCVLSFRSASELTVEIVVRVPRVMTPGVKAKKGDATAALPLPVEFEELSMGRVDVRDLVKTLSGITALMGGPLG